jgi:hypothetical protein
MGTKVSTCVRVSLWPPRRAIAYRPVGLALMSEDDDAQLDSDPHSYGTGSSVTPCQRSSSERSKRSMIGNI